MGKRIRKFVRVCDVEISFPLTAVNEDGNRVRAAIIRHTQVTKLQWIVPVRNTFVRRRVRRVTISRRNGSPINASVCES